MAIQYWTTSDGAKIKVSDMSNRHLINVANYLEKTCPKNQKPEKFYPIYDKLISEINKRIKPHRLKYQVKTVDL